MEPQLLKHKLLSIDPGTSSSPTAVAFWHGGTLLETYAIRPPHSVQWEVRAKIISTELGLLMEYWRPDTVALEKGIYQGKANEMLLSLLAMIKLEAFSRNIEIKEINQMTLKKHFGSGKLEKDQLADIIVDRAPSIKEKNIIKKLIKEQRYDETDSVAVGVWYYDQR